MNEFKKQIAFDETRELVKSSGTVDSTDATTSMNKANIHDLSLQHKNT